MKKVSRGFVGAMLLVATSVAGLSNANARQYDDPVISALAGNGFENLRRVDDFQQVVYTVENNVYKLQPSGVRAALNTIQSVDSTLAGRKCTVIFTDNGIPKLALTSVDTGWKASNSGYTLQWEMVKRHPRYNSSFGDVDVMIYPQLYYQNVIINQMYYYLLELSPAVELTLWPGAKLSAQVIFPVLNDGYTDEYKNIRPGYLTFQQGFRLPYNGWGDVRLGTFDTRTFGLEANATLPLDGNHWYLSAKAAYVGIGLFPDFKKFYYSGDSRFYFSAGPDYYWSNYNILFKLRGERYLMGEMGVKAEMFRHFKHCSVGFYAEKAWLEGVDIHMNGGFRIYIALPPYRYKRYGKVPRVTTGLSTGTTYNAGNERVYYYMPVTLADDNPLKQNQFNAEYIQTYIGK